MQTEWISTAENNRHLIVYFAGWGTSPDLVKNWQIPPGHDVLLVWDYRTLDLNFDFSRYSQRHLVAWSMGVWAAEQSVADLAFATAVAINGTPHLSDDELGIPTAIFQGTLADFNPLTRSKFERRMCGNRDFLQQYQAVSLRSTEEIATELNAVNAHLPLSKPPVIAWRKAIIGEQDQIFPSANQQRYWQQTDCQIEQLTAPHFLFPLLNGWDRLCR
ncbi:hypothetical protein A1D23_12930 [Chelonobacter oris]|uniref:DUF452 family protein n=1 Tax=Chelonobacter oris TaxID=505317 RepID=UPI002446EB98|nr:pimeloyl-ACP methyl esterase BioG family protein [Chelonobacter oris]MDH3001445.1 hypothetical protein [Chelonobacter oris]